MANICYQVNLQRGFGGGERYAISFARALDALGVSTVLFAHPAAAFWEHQLPRGSRIVRVASSAEIEAQLPRESCWLAFHASGATEDLSGLAKAGHRLTCFAHMPLFGRDPAPWRAYELVFPVSAHVLASLQAAGIQGAYPEPLYGAADLIEHGRSGSLHFTSPYYWDRRKLRDRLFSVGYGLYASLRSARPVVQREGITLGIVSRLTPIKQFPLLFSKLVPILLRHPRFNLDIYGAGGYASVRDLRRELAPLGARARLCGDQSDVAAAYGAIDYLMTGLPEREALGLNVLEAQACGCPVLAVDALPFTETVSNEITGLYYRDPRQDEGADFDRLLGRLEERPFRVDAALAAPRLARFSMAALRERAARLLDFLAARGIGGRACA